MNEGFIAWPQKKEIEICAEKKAIYMEIPYALTLRWGVNPLNASAENFCLGFYFSLQIIIRIKYCF